MPERYDEKDLAIIQNAGHFDGAESIFFASELEAVKARTYDKKYPGLSATQNIPVSSEVNPGAETIKYYQYDQVGMAKIISNYADDLPRVDVMGKEFTANIRSIGVSYGYNVQDIRAARMAGKPLEQRRANAAKLANDQTVNKIAYFGDSAHGLVGLFTHANVSVYTLPGDGTSSSTKLADKTPDKVLRDLNGIVQKVLDLTQNIEIPDTMLLPPSVYADIATRPRSDNSDTTILEFFLKNSPYIKNVVPCLECKGAGTGGEDLIFVYRKDPDAVTLEIPQAFEQFPPQPSGLEYNIPCHSRCGGVIFYYPLSAIKASGI